MVDPFEKASAFLRTASNGPPRNSHLTPSVKGNELLSKFALLPADTSTWCKRKCCSA